MPIQSFWTSTYLGDREAHPIVKSRDSETHILANLAYYCPHCGDVWGRITTSQQNAPWNFRSRHCRRCGPGPWRDAGLLSDVPHWGDGPYSFAHDWPEGAIRWEFHSLLLLEKDNV